MIKTISVTLTLTLIFAGCTPKSQPVQSMTEAMSEPVSEAVSETIITNTITEEEPFTQPVMSNYSVDVKEAYNMIQNEPNLLILDVRTPEEIPLDGKIANSVMIPVQVLGQYLNQLDPSKKILVYCHTGNRSLVAMQILNDNGFKVINMAGGISSWSANRFPVEK